MKVVRKNTLDNYLKRVSFYKNKINKDEIYDDVAILGVETATAEYNKTSYSPKAINSIKRQDGVDIIASGKGIAFVEYGTGLVGQGTYKGELPTETLTFESPKGFPQQTQGWEYYYNNPKTKVLGGWFYGGARKVFTRGQPAQAQMYYTSRKLQESMGKMLKSKIRGK